MMLLRVGAIIVVLGLSACKAPSSTSDKPPATALPGADFADGQNVFTPSYNLGDVDVATVVSVRLADRSKSPAITYMEEESLRGNVVLANATVLSPHPENLWIEATIESPLGYPAKDAVLVRMSVTADTRKDPLLTKSYVFSGKGLITKPEHVELDLMLFLQPLPATVLVTAKVQIVWFPDTDPATINPETVDISKGQSLDKLSNPLRIDFK